MPFKAGFALLFNCGFCRTFVYENIDREPPKVAKKAKDGSNPENSKEISQSKEGQGLPDLRGNSSNDVVSLKPNHDKVCLSVSERFQALFKGPQFVLGSAYFESKDYRLSQFERNFDRIKEVFLHGFRSVAPKEMYVKAFSSANWEALPASEKCNHSLSNCVGCATQFQQLQESFPLSPVFRAPLRPIDNLQPCAIGVVHQATGNSFAELAAKQGYKSATEVKQIVRNAEKQRMRKAVSQGYKSAAQVKQIVHKAEKKCIRETQQKCAAECSSQLDSSAVQAVFATNFSFNKYDKFCKIQYYAEPGESSTKKRYPLQPHECDRYGDLMQNLMDWDPATPLVASELAREFNATGTDVSHKIRLLARKENSSIPGLEVVRKPKSTRLRYPGTSQPIGVPPSKKRLVAKVRSLVDNGTLKVGIPCVPVKLRRFRDGVPVVIEAQARKFPMVEVRQSLLDASEQFMRLHSDSEIDSMSKDDVLSILKLGARYSMHQFANANVEDLKACLTTFERDRSIWIWHDHSSLASHGVVAVMVGVVYDSLVFKTNEEVGQNVQEYIEEGAIHMLALCSSTLEDESLLVPERLAELDGLTDEVTSSSGIKIVDTLRFFKGDKPAAQFEAGISLGGNYPCVGCTCHRRHFSDFTRAVTCDQRSVKGIQEVALAGHFGKVPGKLRFYEGLTSNQLRLELEKRAVKNYPKDKVGKLETLKRVLCGVQRVPSLLLFSPETTLSELQLSSYYVLPCEPLHDLKGYLGAVLKMLPSVISESALKSSVSECLQSLSKKAKMYGSDLRRALVEVAHIFNRSVEGSSTGTVFHFINSLVQVSRILYSKDSDRSPKQCLQFYNCAFVLNQLHCELFGKSTSLYFHALLIHGPVQHELVCSRSTNTECEERIFKSAEAAAKCTDRKEEHVLQDVLKRLQFMRSSKTSNPLRSLKVENSRISRSAEKLPPFKGTVFSANFVRKHTYAYEAHLQRIGHYLVLGEGVWWQKNADGNVHFKDGSDHAEFLDAGPELLHFRNARALDVSRRSSTCWQEAVEKKVSLPVDVVGCYDSSGAVTAVVTTEESHFEPELSFDGSFTHPTLSPPQSSTPLRQQEDSSFTHPPPQLPTPLRQHEDCSFTHPTLPPAPSSTPLRQQNTCAVITPEPLEPSEGHDAIMQVGEEYAPEKDVEVMDTEENSQPLNTEGFVDMGIAEMSETSHSTLQSSVSKAIARFVGVTPELQEFDRVRSLCKSQGAVVPVILQKYKLLACQFRKQISLHKRRLESLHLSPSDVGYKKCLVHRECCLKLICSLH